MRKVTFPHMGHSYIAFKMLMEDMGNEVILPPRPSKKTLDLGVKYAPEFACLPYKILLGTYLETAAKGMDTIVTSGGSGPCRAGHYAHLHQAILRSLGHNVDLVCFESPKKHPIDFYRKIQKLNSARLSIRSVIKAIKRGWHKLKALDHMERLSHKIRPRELKKGTTSKVYRQTQAWLDEARTHEQIAEAEAAGVKAFQDIPQDPNRSVLKVGLVGEIYVLLEPASNLEIEETLGHMGVEVERSMFLTGWTRDNLGKGTEELASAIEAAQPYLPELIGGHGRDTVGHTVLYSKRNFDGVIQIAPFTCIPEIVARTILTKVSKIHNIPVLTFFLDEQTGKAGMVTRLEAFVDLLRRRKQYQALEQAAPT
ncbi:putative nucleotide-binding protein (sugar kinase/HSP70/actin superfamily) [Desulfohalotomaculum tongense]|uniref:CoA protein activase n=1 Tax=Desulforadius tongensis TaxID=1216062 RepID=UPI001958E1D9|nr:CoA protein activase [Desulforadius tongensis]MBM7855466.1 putative nucleotide-binding protein (sugar kinase/HSP70/actin superfamily) [Desulforadius tongensis]